MAAKEERLNIASCPRVYLYQLRKKLALSAEEVSRRLEISKNYYHNIENGKRGHNINASLLDRIRNIFKIDASQLLELELAYMRERKKFIELKRKS